MADSSPGRFSVLALQDLCEAYTQGFFVHLSETAGVPGQGKVPPLRPNGQMVHRAARAGDPR